MMTKFQVYAAAVAMALACSVVSAQTRTGTAAIRTSGMQVGLAARPSPPTTGSTSATLPSGRHAGVIQASVRGKANSSFAPRTDFADFESSLGVPGLGFDYPHVAAINNARGNLNSESGRHGHHGRGLFLPILFAGYPYFYDESDYEQQQPPAQEQLQPQIVVAEQPLPAESSVGPASDTESESGPSSAPEVATPVRDAGEFILVQRDGRVLCASMFMVSGTQLTYVTPEGFRRTMRLSDLDTDATQQMNEAHGTAVQIHN